MSLSLSPAAATPTITAVVLAGGLGTRIRQAIGNTAKALAAVEGTTFLDLFLDLLHQAGVGRVVLLTGFDAAAVECEASRLARGFESVTWVREELPLGTGGAVVNALDTLPAELPFLIMNGDTWVDFDPVALLKTHLDCRADLTIAATPIADCSDYGSLDTDDTGKLLAFREKAPGQGLVNAGIYVVSRALVESLPCTIPLSLERDVFPALLREGKTLQVVQLAGPFYDIGTPDRLELFRQRVRDGRLGS